MKRSGAAVASRTFLCPKPTKKRLKRGIFQYPMENSPRRSSNRTLATTSQVAPSPTLEQKMKFRRKRVQRSRNRNQFTFEKFEPRNLLASVTPATIGPIDLVDVAEVSIERTSNEQAVLNHLAVTLETSHLQQNGSDLRLVKVEHGLDQTVTYLQQTYEGVPVFDAFVAVVQGPNGEFEQVLNNGVLEFSKFELTGAHIGNEQATLIADELGEDLDDAAVSTTEDVWFLAGAKVHKGIQVNTFVGDLTANDSRGHYQNVIDTHTGDVLISVKPETLSVIGLEHDSNINPRIVINNAIGVSGARSYAAPFDAVVELALGCTGTLIAPDVVISARHCGGGAGSTLRFGDSTTSTYTATASSVVDPAGGGSLLDGGDVAIWTLTQDVPSNIATPMKLIDEGSSLEGEVAVTLGYGYNGLGSSGHGFSSDGWRWGGENIIDAYGSPSGSSGSNIFSTDFDDGTNGNNTISGSDPTPLQYEATTAPGDSGGPLLVQAGGEWVIAGVLSGGTTSTSVYGDISWWTGVGPFIDQIEAAGGIFVGSGRGSVSLGSTNYQVDDTIDIEVRDANAIAPLQVTLTSDSGDSEIITLTADSATEFSGMINTASGSVSANDGTLQVTLGDEVTVTYVDPDNGDGGSTTHTDVANISNQIFFASANVPINITDNNRIFSDVVITDNGTVNDVDVQLNVTHTYAADLEVFLTGPNGTRIELFRDVGGSGNNFTNTVLDDEASTPIGSGSAPFTGSFRPVGNLGVYDDIEMNGTWTLEIFDDAGADQGVLNGWGVLIDVVPSETEVTLPASGAAITAGNFANGTVGSLEFSDNVDFSIRRSPISVSAVTQFELQANSPILNPNSLEFTLEGSVFARTDVNQTVEFWDYNSSSWVLIDSMLATRFVDSVETFTASGDLSRFVDSNGDIEARVTFQSLNPRQQFTSNTDMASWTIIG